MASSSGVVVREDGLATLEKWDSRSIDRVLFVVELWLVVDLDLGLFSPVKIDFFFARVSGLDLRVLLITCSISSTGGSASELFLL